MSTTNKSLCFCMVVIASSFFYGCGWKFKPINQTMPFKNIFITGANNGVGKEIVQRLKSISNPLNFVSSLTEADVVMRLNVKTERVVVGFSGAGRPRELEIRTTVIIEINDKEEKPLQPMDELKIFRAVTFNDTDVLATQAHEGFHVKDINKQLAIRVIQKLQDVELR